MDFGALPPEVNSARMYAGAGAESLAAAAVAWDSLATELYGNAGLYRSVISGLTTGRWMGPASLSMASAFGPYVAWTMGTAARAEEAAGQAREAVEAYIVAFAATVPPEVVAANRAQLAALIATNFLGQNTAAIAATEALYSEMWAQDAAAMLEYAAKSAVASVLTVFNQAPEVANPLGASSQAAAVAQSAASSVAQHLSLGDLVSSIPTMLQSLASPASNSAAAAGLQTTISSFTTSFADGSLATSFMNSAPYALPNWLQAAATPLYGMSSVLGMASTAQNLANTAGQGLAAAAEGAAAGASSAAAGAANALGSGVMASVGTASSLGPMAVPAGWTSVIPTAPVSTVSALSSANPAATPSVMGALPPNGRGSRFGPPGPRYGNVPTVMARPLAGGYA